MDVQRDYPLRKSPSLNDDIIVCSFAEVTYIYNLTELKWVRLPNRIAPDGVWFACSDADYTDRNANIIKLREEKYEKRKLNSLIIIPTWGCPGKCKYCYAKEHGQRENLTIPKLLRALDERNINPDDIISTIMIGGEPLQNSQMVKFVIDFFYKAEHTICTGLECSDEVLEDFINFSHTRKNFELSVSVDPSNSPRYETESYKRNVDWCSRFASEGMNVRAKATIYPTSYDIFSVRRDLGNIKVDADGVAYGFKKLDECDDMTGVLKMYEAELARVITENAPLNESFIYFGPSVKSLIEDPDSFVPKNCGCGFSFFTIDVDGKLKYCDSPGKAEVDENFDHPDLRKSVTGIREVCSDCSLLPVCGGTCEVEDFKQFYCFVQMLKFSHTLFTFFVNVERETNV